MTKQVLVKGEFERFTHAEGMAWGGLLQVHAALVRRLDAELQAAHGLPLTSYEVLLHLHWAPEHRMRMSELAESTLLSLSGITRLVDRLVQEGLVTRERSSEDRRGNYAVLTAAGYARLCEAQSTHVAGVRNYFLCHFTQGELHTLAEFWQRLLPLTAPDAPAAGEQRD